MLDVPPRSVEETSRSRYADTYNGKVDLEQTPDADVGVVSLDVAGISIWREIADPDETAHGDKCANQKDDANVQLLHPAYVELE